MTDTMNGLRFKDFFSRITNTEGFGQHIDASIPGYAEHRARMALAVTRAFPGAEVLDVGASEGQWGNTIMTLDPTAKVTDIDPNPDMIFNNVNRLSFKVLAAWVDGFWDGDFYIRAFHTEEKYDAIGMHMVRQFVTREGGAWYGETKRFLKEGGVFLLSVKCVAAPGEEKLWQEREKEKDAYKLLTYTQEEMDSKKEEVLIGMHELMMTPEEEEAALKKHFRYVAPIWRSANFWGFVASDNVHSVAKIVLGYEDRL